MRPAPVIFEWVYHPDLNRAYAFVEYDYHRYLGPKERATIDIDGRKFRCSGLVGKSDVDWVTSLFYNPKFLGSVHEIRRKPTPLDGRSSLSSISYAFFVRKELIELSEVRMTSI